MGESMTPREEYMIKRVCEVFKDGTDDKLKLSTFCLGWMSGVRESYYDYRELYAIIELFCGISCGRIDMEGGKAK